MIKNKLEQLFTQLDQVILGNSLTTKLSVTCLLAQGHLLIEDIPGVGKTTLSRALANAFGLNFKRVQFTSDLLPSDIIGLTIYDVDSQKFRFKKGPLFCGALLADEINRASPKTQSALLQAMEEKQVSVDGHTIDLPKPFFVIATQNPIEQSGTYALPESQLDRFLMRLSLGYPQDEDERLLLKQGGALKQIQQTPIFSPEELLELTEKVNKVHTSDALIEYFQTLLKKTRTSNAFVNGLSPRAGLQWLNAARAWAFIQKRDAVLPDDIKLLAPYLATHRLQCRDGSDPAIALNQLLEQTNAL